MSDKEKSIQLKLPPEVAYSEEKLRDFVSKKKDLQAYDYHVARRSIDARSEKVKVNLLVNFHPSGEKRDPITYKVDDLPNVENKPSVIIVGAGPAGIFASLKAIELGCKPILLERGKDVQSRRRDLADINKKAIVNPDSNYCFGEGGAGTYSDGKLYTRSKKRGDLNKVLETLVAHGADEDIMVDAHPHIGTNKLPKIIAAMRQTILDHGGEIHFNTKVTDLVVGKSGAIQGVGVNGVDTIEAKAVILATGHSARDVFELLMARQIQIEAKPFALGVRVEHQQQLIDRIQYHCENRGEYLPAASYSLVQQVNHGSLSRGVFSFCMCPGGFIVPSATSPGEVVVNGMSPSRRDSQYANSGIVVAVENEDLKSYRHHGSLMNMAFQKEVEQRAWDYGGRTQTAPAQRLVDFVNKKTSSSLLPTSYQPGLASVEMREVLPPFIAQRLAAAFKVFGKKMKGYFTNEAQIIGVESRTSSPVKIPRDKDTLEHPQVEGLYPCGEGAGYAGGIVSAAIDGMRCAEKATKLTLKL